MFSVIGPRLSTLAVMLTAASLPALAENERLPAAQSLATILQAAEDKRGRFVLTSGRIVIGRIVKIDGENLWLRKPSGGLVALSPADIATVKIRETNGQLVEGRLFQMADGDLVWRPFDLDDANADRKIVAGGPLIRVDDGLLRQAWTGSMAVAEQGSVEATRPSVELPAETSVDSDMIPRLTISANQAGENEGEIQFRLTLSEPAERSILIIYSTVDGSAKAPGDYSHGQGVVVFEPGQQETIVTTNIVDDAVTERDETLYIFITADPAAVLIEERRTAATISDND